MRKERPHEHRTAHPGAVRIALIYLVIGAVWILFSDRLLEAGAVDPRWLGALQTAKGWLYVLATAALLYWLVRRYLGRLERLAARLSVSEARYRQLVETTPDVLRVSRLPDLETVFVSPAAHRLLGFTAQELVEQPGLWCGQMHEEDRAATLETIQEQLNATRQYEVRYRLHHRDGTTLRWVHERGRFEDAEARVASIVTDVTEREEAAARVAYLTHHDPLTGLLNQQALELVLNSLLRIAARQHTELCCLCIGLDRFAHIKAVYGRAASEQLLVQVGEMLADAVRSSDAVFRIPGATVGRGADDRFLLLLPDTDTRGGRTAADRLMAQLDHMPFEFEGARIPISVLAGIAAYPGHADRPDLLISRAERALEGARDAGSQHVHVLDQDQHREEARAAECLARIEDALRNERFVVHFQPIQHIGSGVVNHYEALVRMQEADGTLVPPGRFIEIAERYGVIERIDQLVLNTVLDYLAEFARHDLDVSIAVNLSAANLGHPGFLRLLRQRFRETGADPRNLVLEITETTAIRDLGHARRFVEAARALGCRFALDDFGIGFTSFSHLESLPVDFVKIDGSFVHNAHTDRRHRGLVRAIAQVAKAYGKLTIAEFVEDGEILELLGRMNVDYAQGFHIGRPAPMTAQEVLCMHLDATGVIQAAGG